MLKKKKKHFLIRVSELKRNNLIRLSRRMRNIAIRESTEIKPKPQKLYRFQAQVKGTKRTVFLVVTI